MITTHNTLITSTGMTPSVIMNEGSVQQLAYCYLVTFTYIYEGRTESHEKLFFFACELGTADEGECGGRWNQLLCYP